MTINKMTANQMATSKMSYKNIMNLGTSNKMISQMPECHVFQNETRNRIIRMNLFMEMCMLGVTFGACVGSIFGMNLNSGIEEHPYAFFLVSTS